MTNQNTPRSIKRSLATKVRSLLAAPPSGSGLATPFTVYNQDHLRLVMKGQLTPQRPCAFVVLARQRPLEPTLPLVICQAKVTYITQELGRATGGVADLEVHVVGRSGGEADDLASFFAANLDRSLALYEYSTGSGLLLETAMVIPPVETWEESLSDQARDEGTYDYWDVVGTKISFLL